MYTTAKYKQTSIKRNTSKKGETIEQKVRRIINNNEPITDGSPIQFTERKDGVLPEYNIRTDRQELAIEAAEAIHKINLAKREAGIEARKTPEQKAAEAKSIQIKDKKDGGAEPIQTTK